MFLSFAIVNNFQKNYICLDSMTLFKHIIYDPIVYCINMTPTEYQMNKVKCLLLFLISLKPNGLTVGTGLAQPRACPLNPHRHIPATINNRPIRSTAP